MPDISDEVLAELKARARASSERAYCPYSKFRVGAALITATGEIYQGCNVENASYGLSVCAERNAVFQMVACGGSHIRAVVIYTPTSSPSAPCGACRQVISEFGADVLIISFCDGPEILKKPLNALLPDSFGREQLE